MSIVSKIDESKYSSLSILFRNMKIPRAKRDKRETEKIFASGSGI